MNPPPGVLGCQNVRKGPLNTSFEFWCTNIAPKLKNIKKNLRKQAFYFTFFSNFDDFLKFVPFGGNISAKTQQFYL